MKRQPPTPSAGSPELLPAHQRASRGLGEVVESLRAVRAARQRTADSLEDQLRAVRRLPPYPPPMTADQLRRAMLQPQGMAPPRPRPAADDAAPGEAD